MKIVRFCKKIFNRIALYLFYMIGMELQDNRGSGSGKRLHRELVWQHSSRHDQHACAGQVFRQAYLKAWDHFYKFSLIFHVIAPT